MMKGDHGPMKQLQDLNWGAFDHTLILTSYNCYLFGYNVGHTRKRFWGVVVHKN